MAGAAPAGGATQSPSTPVEGSEPTTDRGVLLLYGIIVGFLGVALLYNLYLGSSSTLSTGIIAALTSIAGYAVGANSSPASSQKG